MTSPTEALTSTIAVTRVEKLKPADLHDLSDAAEQAIRESGGFGWLESPGRDVMERYWRGVLLIPDRSLFVGRLDGVIGGSVQLVRPPRNNEAQAHAATITTCFVAPWARGHGLGHRLVEAAEAEARWAGYLALNLDVRATQEAAIHLFEALGFRCWGSHPYYARVNENAVVGRYYYKELAHDPDKDEKPR
ncbi:MAG: GNAT family N-acetyltransferase [Rhodospirillaceae bacterium]